MVSKAVQQILDMEDGARLASSDPLVRQWNVEILDQIVQNVVSTMPLTPSGKDLELYDQLRRRMVRFSEELDDEVFRSHVEELERKLNAWQADRVRTVQTLLRHPMTEKIVSFQGYFGGEESPNWIRLKLIGYMRQELLPTLFNVKTSGERDWLHPILENLVYIGQKLEDEDLDGSYDDELRNAVKQFLFKGVVTHPIYQNLLVYERGLVDHSNQRECEETAVGVEDFIHQYLVPFLKDPDVEPSRDEIEVMVDHLEILNDEFSVHKKNLFHSSIKTLKSFL